MFCKAMFLVMVLMSGGQIVGSAQAAPFYVQYYTRGWDNQWKWSRGWSDLRQAQGDAQDDAAVGYPVYGIYDAGSRTWVQGGPQPNPVQQPVQQQPRFRIQVYQNQATGIWAVWYPRWVLVVDQTGNTNAINQLYNQWKGYTGWNGDNTNSRWRIYLTRVQ